MRVIRADKELLSMHTLITAIKESSLSIVLFALFTVCIFAESFVDWRLQNQTLTAHGQATLVYWQSLSTGTSLTASPSIGRTRA